jgi:hypothetical protein
MKAKAKRPKRCGTAGCSNIAKHWAHSGWMKFALCDDHAATAHLPPLRCTSLEPIEEER